MHHSIKRAFKKLSLILHPDHHMNDKEADAVAGPLWNTWVSFSIRFAPNLDDAPQRAFVLVGVEELRKWKIVSLAEGPHLSWR